MSYYLEETVVETALFDLFNEFCFCGFVVAIEYLIDVSA
jgi:hypothetical protein